MNLHSHSWQDHGHIAARHATVQVAGGQNVSPHFGWTGVPANARSLVLTIVDHHPIAEEWVHWMVVNLPVDAAGLPEHCSGTAALPKGAVELVNGFGKAGYGGPQPPPGSGSHPYVATLYALDVPRIELSGRATEAHLLGVIRRHIIGKAIHTSHFGH
jgi:Raf kinase inhibitor-like YbhB/YbcL family protein